MARHRCYITSIYGAIVIVLAPVIAWAGVDPVQFFTQESPLISQKLESDRGVEKYLARDKFGNLLHVKFGDPLSMFGEIGGSLLAQGLELPSLPVYPAFIQTDSKAKALRASVQPHSSPGVSVRSVERLTPLQTGEWLGQMVFNHVIGNPDVLTQPDRIALSGQHVMTPDLSRAFRSYERGKLDSLANYLDRIPSSGLQSLSEKDATQALIQLNRYISRLEKLSPNDVTNLFGAYFEAAANLRRSKRLPQIDYRAEFQRRIQAVRTEASAYLKKRYPHLPVAQSLDRLARVDRPAFLLPAFEKSQHVEAASEAPENMLWSKFFQDPAKSRPQSSTGDEGKVSGLLEQARKRDKIYYVGPTLNPEYFDTEMRDPPQTHLNPKNAKTLVVVPTNDFEAIDIARIAEVSGAQVMKLRGDEYIHGSKLTPALAEQIIERAQRLRVDTVAVVEMPGEPLDVESVFSKHGLKFVPIDHHDRAGVYRAQPFSSLEQAAQMLGYDLGGMSKVIEVNDRSFLAGLKDLGLSKQAVIQLFPPQYGADEIQRFSKFKSSRFGDFYVVRGFSGNFSELTSAITLHEWPKPVNVLLLGHQLRFSGNPKFRETLWRTFQEYEGQVKTHVYGGDAIRAQYWILNGIPRKSIDLFTSKVVGRLEAALDRGELEKFRGFLSSRAPSASKPSRCVVEQVQETLSNE